MKTRQLLVLSIYGSGAGGGGMGMAASKAEVLEGADLLYAKYTARTECCFHANLHLDIGEGYSRSGNWIGGDWKTDREKVLSRLTVVKSNLGQTLEGILSFLATGPDTGVYIVGHCGTGTHDCGISRMKNEHLARFLAQTLGLKQVRKMSLVACNAASPGKCSHLQGTVARDLHAKLKQEGIETVLAGYAVAVFTRPGDAGGKTFAPPGARDNREAFGRDSRAAHKKVFAWDPRGDQVELTAADFHDNGWM